MACFSIGRNSKVLRALSYTAINFYPTPAEMNMCHSPLSQRKLYRHFDDAGFFPLVDKQNNHKQGFSYHEII